MNLLRVVTIGVFAVGLSLGAAVAFTVGYLWPHDHDAVQVDDPLYQFNKHTRTYYDLLRIEHTPVPEDWIKGKAGTDYCLNLTAWYVLIYESVVVGANRDVIMMAYSPGMEYELQHGWLTPDDKRALLLFIDNAPLFPRLSLNVFADAIFDVCDRTRNSRV